MLALDLPTDGAGLREMSPLATHDEVRCTSIYSIPSLKIDINPFVTVVMDNGILLYNDMIYNTLYSPRYVPLRLTSAA